jgi:two-component system sensor histidine kinase/response regulator
LAHTLKGVASNVGAVEVQAVAGQLEARAKQTADKETPDDGEALRQLVDALETCHAPLIQRLSAALTRTVAEKPPADVNRLASVAPERLQAIVRRLIAMLEDNNAEAGDLLQAEHELLHQGLQDVFDELKEAVEHFDFDRALEILRAFRVK